MLFMVVERFAQGRAQEIYRVAREQGRMLPDGLVYVDSWVSAALDVCFLLMECEDPVLFQEWVLPGMGCPVGRSGGHRHHPGYAIIRDLRVDGTTCWDTAAIRHIARAAEHLPPLSSVMCSLLKFRQDLTLVEVNEPRLVRSDLMNVDVIEPGINVRLDLFEVLGGVRTTSDRLGDFLFCDQL
jgi:hypothetical protein